MTDLVSNLICGLLGVGTGIFAALSLLEKPTWRLMREPHALTVVDEEARSVHAILKRVIHLLPPTMMTTMGSVSVLIILQLWKSDLSATAIAVTTVFFVQLVMIVSRLFKDIRGVDSVPSDGDIAQVREGLGALALLHHRGLLMTTSTLVAQWVLIGL